MLTTVPTALRQRFNNWLFRPKIDYGTVVLTQRRIYIVPTKQGAGLAVLLLLLLTGDINYNLSLGYALTFTLAMMAFMSMLHAFRNLAHLEIRTGKAEPVFCGEMARFALYFDSELPRYQLCLTDQKDNRVSFDIAAGQSREIFFPLPALNRGWLKTGRLKLYTEFPLGLFHAWSYLHFDTSCLIYAKPLEDAPLPEAPGGAGARSGDDDFAGLRNYTRGDALPRIAWKSYAQGHELQVKQFSSEAGKEIWLDLSKTPDQDLEGKLSRMTRWVLDAEALGLRYGLSLPNFELPPSNGAEHRDACLRKIALIGLPVRAGMTELTESGDTPPHSI